MRWNSGSIFGPHDADAAFRSAIAEAQLRRGEEAIDDHVVASDPVVDELRCLTGRPYDEEDATSVTGPNPTA
jgi:hypothetical protein